MAILPLIPCALICDCLSPINESFELQTRKYGMFYCSLCEVEVFKYNKHCRVCDKCVDRSDHHCRNNCVGKKNYRKFFTLMVFALLLVRPTLSILFPFSHIDLICCFLDHKRFSLDSNIDLQTFSYVGLYSLIHM
ncbi:Zinc finger, DHHC-type, palmitoyltransferase, partial [Cynara cardunculus var. scolymus]